MSRPTSSRAHRFTVTIPASLYEQGEQDRHALGLSRSEYVAALYRDHLNGIARQQKIARYREAYAHQPPTPEEDALTELSEQLLASQEP
jgi:hypothetical protein